jgi:thymidylate kinase
MPPAEEAADAPITSVPWPARLNTLFRSFDAAGVRWCLLRPAASLSRTDGDIDILIEPETRDVVARIVVDQRFVILPMRESDLHALDYDLDSDRFMWLHIQTVASFGGEAVPARLILDEVVRDPLPRPTNSSLAWIVLLHGLIDKGELRAPAREALNELAADAHQTFGDGDADAKSRPWRDVARRHGLDPDRVAALALAGDWNGLEAIAPVPVKRPVPLTTRARDLWTWRGVSVAVIGPDGAGKTTLVNGLCPSLPFPTRVIYMGLTGGRMPYADALRVPGLVFSARLGLLAARYGLSMYHRARGRIVLFDRYPLDAAVPSGYDLRPLARVSRRVQGAACPRPTVVLLLDAPGSMLQARSGEYDAVTLESWRRAYLRLRRPVKMLEVIDAQQSPDRVRQQALAIIWDQYAARWGPVSRRARTDSG